MKKALLFAFALSLSLALNAQDTIGRRYEAIKIGQTNYDLQTNAAMARRLIVYPDGKATAVWTFSNSPSPWPDRGTNFTHFDGADWQGQRTSRIESLRHGWPNIVTFEEGFVQKEAIISHRADVEAGSTRGGMVAYKNSGIGKDDFQPWFVLDTGLTYGPIWPRVAVSGDYFIIVGSYQDTSVVMDGIRAPIVYYRYNYRTNTLETSNALLPGYDSTRYRRGGSDTYSIDASGSTVAIAIGGQLMDLAMWKSVDNGATWTKTVLDTFPGGYWRQGITFDTVFTNDGGVHLLIDYSNRAHVFASVYPAWDDNPDDEFYTWVPRANVGIAHWREGREGAVVAARAVDYDGDGVVTVADGNLDITARYVSALPTSFPSAAIDEFNEIYLVYSSVNELIQREATLRDIYVVATADGGETWTAPQNLTPAEDGNEFAITGMEHVYPMAAREIVDGHLHLIYMEDEFAGTVVLNNHPAVPSDIMYKKVPVEDILQGLVEDRQWETVSVPEIQRASIHRLYPNPASQQVFIELNPEVAHGKTAYIQIMDVAGRTVGEKTVNLSQNGGTISMDIAGYRQGIYMVKVSVGNNTSIAKLVVQ